MWLAACASTLHVLGIAMALGAVFMRARFLRSPLDRAGLHRVLSADNIYGVSAILVVGSGLWRAFGGVEKGPSFFLDNGLFWVKMGLFATVFALETFPMVTFIRWRITLGAGGEPDVSRAATFARISEIEVAIMVAMLVVAPLMARGVWLLE